MGGAVGLYIHVPFCAGKCPYCDFYSLPANAADMDAYCEKITHLAANSELSFDSVYLGGGTPSQLGTKRLLFILEALRGKILPGSEISLECNPSDVAGIDCSALRRGGYNRVSLGLQSAVEGERRELGRRGGPRTVEQAVSALVRGGFNNLSLDIMLGVPGQTSASLPQTLDFAVSSGATHISAYMLKIEEGTPFASRSFGNMPSEDEQAELYLLCCEELEKNGFLQYEISNFSRRGFESRHNLKYWRCEEYLGLGPGAHSFLQGERFACPRDLRLFLRGDGQARVVTDSSPGGFEEYAMLALRLREGLLEDTVRARFGYGIPLKMRRAAGELQPHGLLFADESGIRLTRSGFLLSNSVIGHLLRE